MNVHKKHMRYDVIEHNMIPIPSLIVTTIGKVCVII